MRSRSSPKKIQFPTDPQFIALLERGAKATGKSKTALVRDAVREHVARIEAGRLACWLEAAYRGLNDLNAELDRELSPADAGWLPESTEARTAPKARKNVARAAGPGKTSATSIGAPKGR